VGVALGTNHR